MAKTKIQSVFFCTECGSEQSKWTGQCPVCKAWNTLTEQTVRTTSKSAASGGRMAGQPQVNKPIPISKVSFENEARISTKMLELDRVLGGGIVPGSLTLVGGDPGIGKSTLLLQVMKNLADCNMKVLYVSGEESLRQIKLRANRIGSMGDSLLLLCETSLDRIYEAVVNEKPEVVVIDSIQTMSNDNIDAAPGSVSQIRESTAVLMQLAKGLGVCVMIIGHVTKEGAVAGPRVLEHMVDTVLYFEGDRHASYRLLRGVKNRFGSTDEIGVFEMSESGLTEVHNPSEYMLNGKAKEASGSVVACCIEGTRPIMLEIQALVCPTNFGFPKRSANGTDFNRVNLLMAVLEKRVGLQLSNCDAYVNLAGGMKINEPALDLGIVMAVVSSFKNKPISDKTVVFGEVGLSGEVRAVSLSKQRILEAVKLGFDTVVLPRVCMNGLKEIEGIKLIGIDSVDQAIEEIFRI